MSDINEVPSRLECAVEMLPGSRIANDVGALLADHARLQQASSIDLEQFREAVVVARTYYAEMAGDIHDPAHNDVADCDRLLALIDGKASPKGGEVQDDRSPRGLIDAIEYADNMEEAAEGLYQHVFEHESDGEDCGTVILQRVLGYMKASPKGEGE